jgi:16S rRNA (adenine1518-N6/adenine1519-N6)-dimethyltransferase
VKRNTSDRSKPHAKKALGQNFLVASNYIKKIVDAARLLKNETVIEIGPGRGALTRALIERAGRVVAVEFDEDLVPVLRDQFREHRNFELIHADILKLDLSTLAEDQRLKLVANLPYNISTAVLQHLIENRQYFSDMVLMFQREVVDRIVAEPGNSERGYLTVMVEAYLKVEKLFDVPPSAFRPTPKVWSSVVRLKPKVTDPLFIDKELQFERLVSSLFRQKRKTILNNLKAASSELGISDPVDLLNKSEIDPARRAETLTAEEWARLFTFYAG